MKPIATRGGGQAFAFPDVCKVPAPPAPPVPVPFPNIAMLSQADSSTCSENVRVLNQPVITVESEVPRSMGDEAGTAMGVVSGTQMDKVVFRQGSPNVRIEGAAPVSLMDPTAHNGSSANAPAGNVIAPGQTDVLLGG
jgi:hypothetical protein